MAEQLDINSLKNLTSTQINCHLERKDSEHPCEACGNSEWVFYLNNDNEAVFMQGLTTLGTTGAYMFLPLICNACGNTRFINAAMLLREILEHEGHITDGEPNG